MKTKKSKNTSWGLVADWYDELVTDGDSLQQTLILPNLLRLIKPGPKIKILDVACGQGLFAREFAAAGAVVTGIDISPELIEIARRNSHRAINYVVAPAEKIPFPDTSFDAVAIILALQNMENFSGALAECGRVLKPQGRLFIVLNHPAFRIPGRSAWGFDDDKKNQFRRLDGYLSESRKKIVAHPGLEKSAETVSFHRPLQAYFKALEKAGFLVQRLEEWTSPKQSQPGPRSAAENAARREFPLFMYIEAIRG